MLHPVGSQPPSVYWRRRLVLIGSAVLVIVLLVVTVRAVTSGGGGSATAAGSGSPTATPTGRTPVSTAPARTSSSRPASSARSSTRTSRRATSTPATSSASSSAPPATCRAGELSVSAVVGASNYRVGAMPMLEMQVTNVGRAPCVQDLADKQIVLKVYNGESRVWGSHDCEVQSGTQLRTLAAGSSVRVTITWSGLTSQPNDCSSRQRVGAGTYTLYATLSGKTGKAAQFTIS